MSTKKVVVLGLVAAIGASSLTGCGLKVFKGDDILNAPLVPALSRKEVIDYYKESLQYDTIATRTTKPNEVTLEKVEVTGEMKKKLVDKTHEIEELLKANSVTNNQMNTNVHRFMKYMLDDKVLSQGKAIKVEEALGHYFVDIEYNMSAKGTGSFKDDIKYFGINGGFKEDLKGNVSVDKYFMNKANTKVEEFKKENPDFKLTKAGAKDVRRPKIDVTLYNTAAGMSLTQTAMMPALSMIYNIPEAGSLSGYGIYPEGQFTMKDFGYDRSKMGGKLTIRYVFKQELMNPTKIEFTNCYVTEFKLSTTPKIDENTVIPEFVELEAAKLLERADRAIINNDLSALMNGKIYEDVGPAVLHGSMREYCNKQRHMSKVVNICGRDDHKYLVEFETTTQESAKNAGTMGTYVYKGYFVMQQVDTEFHITDYVRTEMFMQKEPQIDTDSTILKRLAALNLSGEVTDEAKHGIRELMTGLWTASTERRLEGMYNSFNSNTDLLSSTRREYLNAQIRSLLVQHGVNVQSVHTGVISEWVGGADNQVEFFTNELIEYPTLGNGVLMKNYYLVSNYDTKWVIDEMKIVESKDIEGEELNSIKVKFNSGASVAVEGADNKAKEDAEAAASSEVKVNEQQEEKEPQSLDEITGTEQQETPETDQTEQNVQNVSEQTQNSTTNEETQQSGEGTDNLNGALSDDGWS